MTNGHELPQGMASSRRRTRQSASAACVLACLSALSGCAGGSHLVSTRQPMDAATLSVGREIHDAIPASIRPGPEPWWRVWDDEQLDHLVMLASARSPDLQLVRARLDRARAQLDAGEADRTVQLDLHGDASADRYPGHDTYPAPYAGNTGSSGSLIASVRLHLDLWGKWRSRRDAARWAAQAAGHQLDDARLSLQLAVVATYLQWDGACRLLDVQLTQREHLRQRAELVEARKLSGLANGLEVTRANNAVSVSGMQLIRTRQSIARYRHALAALTGQPPAFADTLQAPRIVRVSDPAPISSLPAHLLGMRPDVAARRSGLEAASRSVDAARAGFYPDVDLGAFAGLSSLGLGHLFEANSTTASIGPALTLPIFDGGRLRANLKSRIADYDEAIAAYDATLLQALQQVADSVTGLNTGRQQLQEAQDALAQTQRLVHLQEIRSSRGLAAHQDQLDADLDRLQAQAAEIQADLDVGLAQVALAGAVGGTWVFSSPSPNTKNSHD